MTKRRNKTNEKPYVLTLKDAWALLASASNYVHTPDRAIGGTDRADILAAATLAKGLTDLSGTISGIHSSVMQFQKGNYEAIAYLLESPVIRESLKEEADGTEYETAAERLVAPLGYVVGIEDKLRGRTIDWAASSEVVLKVKGDQFPEDLTLVEKLAVAKLIAGRRSR